MPLAIEPPPSSSLAAVSMQVGAGLCAGQGGRIMSGSLPCAVSLASSLLKDRNAGYFEAFTE